VFTPDGTAAAEIADISRV